MILKKKKFMKLVRERFNEGCCVLVEYLSGEVWGIDIENNEIIRDERKDSSIIGDKADDIFKFIEKTSSQFEKYGIKRIEIW